MAVYTRVSIAELTDAIDSFGLKLLNAPEGVADGIENTTYFFDALCQSGESMPYVLTILENCPQPQRRFSSALTKHLASANLPVPSPLVNRLGEGEFSIAAKPAFIFPKISGAHVNRPDTDQCRVIGDFLARAHLASLSFEHKLANNRGLPWLISGQENLAPFLSQDDNALLNSQVVDFARLCERGGELPSGAIHGDLFRDNALFNQGSLAAVIDFYNACTDWLLIDIAIAINDWCSCTGGNGIDQELANALLKAYHQVRPFTAAEQDNWQNILCFAATRFWVSRLLGIYGAGLSGSELKSKDPDEYSALLKQHIVSVPPLPI
jgi:homoserine kinase type II